MRVAIQGIAGSFHHEAAEQLLGKDIELVTCNTFAEVFRSLKSGKAESGIVAVENSLHGSINAVYRLLARQKFWVAGEVFLKIEQYLIAAEPIPPEDFTMIEAVFSQAPALAQCEQWLDTHVGAVLEETHDTAASVEYVMRYPEKSLAAVAGKRAAALYGGHIIAGPINDERHNYTRFFLLTPKQINHGDANKTSLILETSHEPGALYRALGVFAEAGVNLSKLDSHPIPGDTWHYAFYLDFEAGAQTEAARQIIAKLESQGCKVVILGSYRAGALPK